MSDKDKDKDSGKEPLKKEKVSVTVNPNGSDWEKKQYSQNVKKRLKEDVERAVKEAAPNGADAQFDAANKKIDEAKQGVDSRKVNDIEVEIEGIRKDERGKDEQISRKRKVKPGD